MAASADGHARPCGCSWLARHWRAPRPWRGHLVTSSCSCPMTGCCRRTSRESVACGSGFAARPDLPVSISVEYLDNLKFSGETYEQTFVTYLRDKYAQQPPEVLMVAAEEALDFVLRHRSELFPRVPIVHMAVEDELPAIEGTFAGGRDRHAAHVRFCRYRDEGAALAPQDASSRRRDRRQPLGPEMGSTFAGAGCRTAAGIVRRIHGRLADRQNCSDDCGRWSPTRSYSRLATTVTAAGASSPRARSPSSSPPPRRCRSMDRFPPSWAPASSVAA